MGLKSEWFLITLTPATTPSFSIFTHSSFETGAFFKWTPMFASKFLTDGKKMTSSISFRKQSAKTPKFQIWVNSDENIIVRNCCEREKYKYSADAGELSSVKNLFWANHTTRKDQINLQQTTLSLTHVPENNVWLKFSHFGEPDKKWPKKAQKD